MTTTASSPPPYTCWASADEWRPGFVMLGANVGSIIPSPPPRSDVIIGTDGLWGAHEWTVYPQPHHPEFPYLSWIPVHSNSDILTRTIDKSMWRTLSHASNTRVIDPILLEDLKARWKSIKAALEGPFTAISTDLSSSVQCPWKAYARAFEALSGLEKEFVVWRDFVEVFRNLQRSFLELCAFLDWWEDVRAGASFQPRIRAPTRGAIFEDPQLYASYVRLSVRAFLLIQKSTFVLDLALEVTLSPWNLCEQPMSLQPLLHSLPHWYYPPLVHDVVAELESAARGYMERLDTFNPTKGFKRKLDKVQNKMNDQAGRNAKKAKTSVTAKMSNHPELIRLTGAGAAPDWFPRIQEVWTHAVSHVSHLKLASVESPRRFALPPVHLFWGGEPQNQRIYFYHLLVLFNEIRNRPKHDLPALTTQEWRSVLGNTYWKRHWAKRDGNDLSQGSIFDPNVFWKYGGPLLFGDQRSADIAARRYNPTSPLPCFCDVQIATADDTNVREVVLYHLNSFHVCEEIRQMERVQFPTTFEKRWVNQVHSVQMIVEMYPPRGGKVNPDFSHDSKVWRLWVWAVRDVVKDWDGFDGWDWGSFSEARRVGITELSTQDFSRFTNSLLAFFIHSFVTRLGYYPSPLLRPPVLSTHNCVDHRKKFGDGGIIFPIPIQ